MKRLILLIACILMVVLIGSACSGNENPENTNNNPPSGTDNPPKKDGNDPAPDPEPEPDPAPASFSNDPVTLTVFGHGNQDQKKFDKNFGDPAKELLPHITFEFIKSPVEGVNNADVIDAYSQLVTSGDIPDMLMGVNFHTVNFGLATDLNPLIKKYNVDISQIHPALIAQNQKLSPADELYAIPNKGNWPTVLHYNKDIFDRFGIDYPKDGLFYDEYAELVGRIARMDDGVLYRGGNLDNANRIISQLSLEYVDENFEPLFLSDPKWTAFANFWKDFHEIPNNDLLEDGGNKGFMESQTIAMRPYGVGLSNRISKVVEETGMQWDFAAYPTFREAPGVMPFTGGGGMGITPESKNADAAFQVIQTLAFNEEYHYQRAREGQPAPINIPRMKEDFGADWDAVQGKNREAIYFNPHEGMQGQALYGNNGPTIAFRQMMKPIRDEGMDVVEALRLADEALRESIAIEMEARPPE